MRKFSDAQEQLIINKYFSNSILNTEDLAKEFNVNRRTISQIIKRNGFKLKPKMGNKRKYICNSNYFDIINTEDKAYFLGLLYADGCNYKGALRISLQEDDKHILESMCEKINNTRPISFYERSKINLKYKNMYTAIFRDKHLSEQATKLGCPPKKSLILNFPTEEQVPNYLLQHFIRGYMDGDGCIGYYKVTNKNFFVVHVSLASSMKFLKSFKEFVKENFDANFNIRTSNHGNKLCGQGAFSSKYKAINFLNWLYKDSSIYLYRKYSVYKNIISKEKKLHQI